MFLKVKATEGVNTVIKAANKVANRYNNNEIASEHLLYGLAFSDSSISSAILKEFGVTSGLILSILENAKTNSPSTLNKIELTEKCKKIFKIAGDISTDLGSLFMGSEHLLFALMVSSENVAVTLLEKEFNVDIFKLKSKIANVLGLSDDYIGEEEDFSSKDDNPSLASNLPSELLDMGTDLTLKAIKGQIDPIIGRENEIDEVLETLCRKGKNSPILIGNAGVGKSAIIEGLAIRIIKGKVPLELQNKIVYSLDIGSLLAGTRYRGALEEKLKKAIDIILSRKDIILFIDEIHTLMQAGDDSNGVSPANMLKPHLARGTLQTIGATTTEEYKKFIEKDKAIERRFQTIVVHPPTIEQTIEILKGLKLSYENFHHVTISDDAIIAAVELSDRYIADRNLPDKAIDLIDQASSKGRINTKGVVKIIKDKEEKLEELNVSKQQAMKQQNFELASRLRDEINLLGQELHNLNNNVDDSYGEAIVINKEHIAKMLSSWTGIPVTKITETEKARLMHLEETLHNRIIGQNEAVTAVSRSIRRARVGLKDSNRPIGSFIFLGQTGVGKTELCKALAESMFDNENAIIRLDMSEYMESHSVSKLIGSPAGYVGYDEGGQLTDAVRAKPYSVVLFDEVEKAHPEVLNIMLQVLEDGRLTDSKGKVVSFKNTIIIFTSNAGVNKLAKAKELTEKRGEKFSYQVMSAVLKAELKNVFKPEFLNRIDNITIFHQLEMVDLAKITKIMIIRLNKKLAKQKLTLRLTENAFKYIIKKGADSEYGARPLRRIIEHEIEDKIAEELLTSTLQENGIIIVDLLDEKLIFKY